VVSARTKASLWLIALSLLCSSCGFSFERGPWNIRIRNDTVRRVIVNDCRTSACRAFRYSKAVSPGVTVAALDYGDGTSWWLVLAENHRRLGCLTLGVSKRVGGYVLRLSTLGRCPVR
jgi:hypothetical protein